MRGGPNDEPVEVDDVEVGPQPGRQQAAVEQAVELGGLAGLAVHDVLEGQPRAPARGRGSRT